MLTVIDSVKKAASKEYKIKARKSNGDIQNKNVWETAFTRCADYC